MISPKWSELEEHTLGNCHWCKYMKSEDGKSTCTNPESVFCDGNRIRTWDGLYCAERCELFELNEWTQRMKAMTLILEITRE